MPWWFSTRTCFTAACQRGQLPGGQPAITGQELLVASLHKCIEWLLAICRPMDVFIDFSMFLRLFRLHATHNVKED